MSDIFEENTDSGEAIRVFVRIRPLNKRELAENQTIGWDFDQKSMLEDTPNGHRVYNFDYCFSPDQSNRETYDIVGRPIVLKALEGYNGTVFTYGQTGSGKTWTMRGNQSDPGMMILCIQDIFDWVDKHSNTKFILRVSYMEVYNEEINDLLGDGVNSKNLRIVSEDANRGVTIGGLVEEICKNVDDFMSLLARGEEARSYASTNMNADSSRSHTIYRVCIEAKDLLCENNDQVSNSSSPPTASISTKKSLNRSLSERMSNSDLPDRVSYLNLVDLAGSERQKSTGATGKTLKEGSMINRSLLTLGAVISKLSEACKKTKNSKPVFVPFRDSKLTRILKQSLGGNTLTSILCTVTPAPMHREETVSTLKFGQLCKTVKTVAKQNSTEGDDKILLKQYRQVIIDLKSQIENLQQQLLSMGIVPTLNTSDNFNESPTETSDETQRIKSADNTIFYAKIRYLESLLVKNHVDIDYKHISGINSSNDNTTEQNTSIISSNEMDILKRSFEQEKQDYLTKIQQLKADLSKQTEKTFNLQNKVLELQQLHSEYQELEEAKHAFEDYQSESAQILQDEKEKIEIEKQFVLEERGQMLQEKQVLDEKEARLNNLLSTLDHRESKLRQILSKLKDDQKSLEHAEMNLKKKEDFITEWKATHAKHEERLKKTQKEYEAKITDLDNREGAIREAEDYMKKKKMELNELERKTIEANKRATDAETEANNLLEKLKPMEALHQKKTMELEFKERELAIHRKDIDTWHELLRHKDKKLMDEEHELNTKTEGIRILEEKNLLRSQELDMIEFMLKERENDAAQIKQRFTALNNEKVSMEEQYLELKRQNERLSAWEHSLRLQQERIDELERREFEVAAKLKELEQAEEDFYSVKVAQISTKHRAQVVEMQSLIDKQLEAYGSLKKQYQAQNMDLNMKLVEIMNYETSMIEKDDTIDKLNAEISALRTELNLHQNESYRVFKPIAMKATESQRHYDNGSQLNYPDSMTDHPDATVIEDSNHFENDSAESFVSPSNVHVDSENHSHSQVISDYDVTDHRILKTDTTIESLRQYHQQLRDLLLSRGIDPTRLQLSDLAVQFLGCTLQTETSSSKQVLVFQRQEKDKELRRIDNILRSNVTPKGFAGLMIKPQENEAGFRPNFPPPDSSPHSPLMSTLLPQDNIESSPLTAQRLVRRAAVIPETMKSNQPETSALGLASVQKSSDSSNIIKHRPGDVIVGEIDLTSQDNKPLTDQILGHLKSTEIQSHDVRSLRSSGSSVISKSMTLRDANHRMQPRDSSLGYFEVHDTKRSPRSSLSHRPSGVRHTSKPRTMKTKPQEQDLACSSSDVSVKGPKPTRQARSNSRSSASARLIKDPANDKNGGGVLRIVLNLEDLKKMAQKN